MNLFEVFRRRFRRDIAPTPISYGEPVLQPDQGWELQPDQGLDLEPDQGWDPDDTLTWTPKGSYRFVKPQNDRHFHINVDVVLERLNWEAGGWGQAGAIYEFPIVVRSLDIDEKGRWLEFLALLCGMASAYDSQDLDTRGLTFQAKAEFALFGSTVLDAFQPIHGFQVSTNLEDALVAGSQKLASHRGRWDEEVRSPEYTPLNDWIAKRFPDNPYKRGVHGESRANRASNQQRLFNILTDWVLTGGFISSGVTADAVNELGEFAYTCWPPDQWYE